LSPEQAGLVLLCQPALMALGSPFAGRLSDRIEPRIVASLGVASSATGLFLLARLNAATPLWYVVVCLVFLGVGFALFSSPNVNAIMSSVDRSLVGVASATFASMRLAGQLMSMALATMMLALFVGRVQITSEHYGAFLSALSTTFGLCAGLCCVALVASLARGKLR
jgi:MFS family permease